MRELISGYLIYSVYLVLALISVIAASFSLRRRDLWPAVGTFVLLGFMLALAGIEWRPVILNTIALFIIPLIVINAKNALEDYKRSLIDENISIEKGYNELIVKEGAIYDTQLKFNDKLSEISSLYEITKEMSTCLKYADIFNVLARYMQKIFIFKEAKLILINPENENVCQEAVYRAEGLRDNEARAKGIFPKLDISQRSLSDHDRKIYELSKGDIKRIQIVNTTLSKNPYADFLPKGAKTFMAIPMIVDNKIKGILTIEDLEAKDFEKYSILSSQFSLEIRRIILYEKIEQMAITDGLTKAFSKRYMMERLHEEFERSSRHDFNLSFIMIDIDHFKSYNDIYGHMVGDVVLRDIVALLKVNMREVDLVGRFGGEEFCVILPETNKEEAFLVSERIREIVEGHRFKAYDELTNVTISVGIATYPKDSNTVDELIERSDQALYKAKSSGRNRVCLFQ